MALMGIAFSDSFSLNEENAVQICTEKAWSSICAHTDFELDYSEDFNTAKEGIQKCCTDADGDIDTVSFWRRRNAFCYVESNSRTSPRPPVSNNNVVKDTHKSDDHVRTGFRGSWISATYGSCSINFI